MCRFCVPTEPVASFAIGFFKCLFFLNNPINTAVIKDKAINIISIPGIAIAFLIVGIAISTDTKTIHTTIEIIATINIAL